MAKKFDTHGPNATLFRKGIDTTGASTPIKISTDGGATTGTCTTAGGYITVKVGSTTRYIQLYTGNGA